MRFQTDSGNSRALRRVRVIAISAVLAAAAPALAQQLPAGAAKASLPATAAAPAAAPAPAPIAASTPAAIRDGAESTLRYMVEREFGTSYRVEISLGQLDPRLQLAPCGRAEPFLPPGARLWGRGSIGVRCVEGASWSVLLPVTVAVFGPALVAAAPLPAGATPTTADFRIQEVDLTREHGPAVNDPAALAGKILSRPIVAGQVLKEDALRAPPAVNAGDPVRIHVVGQGFSIWGEGVALNAAAEGERVRVRTESGKVLVGPIRNRSVELKL